MRPELIDSKYTLLIVKKITVGSFYINSHFVIILLPPLDVNCNPFCFDDIIIRR